MIITLKDGSQKEYESGISVIDIAADISEGLARAACAGEIDGQVVDLRTPVEKDCVLSILTAKDEKGLHALRHTASHVLAQAVKRLYPDAKVIASNLPEITIATRNPDTVENAQALNGTDVGIIRGMFGVAENACIWIPQTMKEKAVCFISENLVILLPKSEIVNNMHEAYKRIKFNNLGYGTFISGPSKTADIAQVLVMGAQAARSVTVLLLP